MKYAVIKVVNGIYAIHSEGWEDLEKAKVNYFGLCQTLHDAADVNIACAMITDENLNCVEGYREFVNHLPAPEPNEA